MNIQKKFFLNGYQFYINQDLTLQDILYYFNYKNRLFILEYNSSIYDQNQWSKIKINSNDTVEIITIVGGG